MADDVIYVGLADIVKTAPTPEGTLLVYGRAAGETLDLDGQGLDRDWLASELPAWFKTAANMREMHQPIAAGVGKELEFKTDSQDWWLLSEAVDPVTITKLEKGVLTGYSVGIKAPKIIRDGRFPKGKIAGGKIIEISYGDRPADPLNKIDIMKTAGDPDPEASLEQAAQDLEETGVAHALSDDELKMLLPDVGKTDYSTEQRVEMAKKGEAIPVKNADGEIVNGAYPIGNEADLKNAVSSYGRASDKEETKTFITKRAKALKATDDLPEDWEGSTKGKLAEPDVGKDAWEAMNIAEMRGQLQALRDQLGPIGQPPATDGGVLAAVLAGTVDILGRFLFSEQFEALCEDDEGEPTEDGMVGMTASSHADKTPDADGDPAAPDITKVATADALKTLVADTMKAALEDGLAPVKEELAKVVGLTERIDKLEEQPAAPKVVLSTAERGSSVDQFTQPDALTALSALRERHQQMAEGAADPTLKSAHTSKVAEIDRAIRALPGS